LLKGKALRKHSLHEKTAASVLLELFISSNFHEQNLKNNICIKQTNIEIQNESKTIVATSVSKAVT